jgi:hypothetical protein
MMRSRPRPFTQIKPAGYSPTRPGVTWLRHPPCRIPRAGPGQSRFVVFCCRRTRQCRFTYIGNDNLYAFHATARAVTRTIPLCARDQCTAAIDGDRAITGTLRRGRGSASAPLPRARRIVGRTSGRPGRNLTDSVHKITLCHKSIGDCPVSGGTGSWRWQVLASRSRVRSVRQELS